MTGLALALTCSLPLLLQPAAAATPSPAPAATAAAAATAKETKLPPEALMPIDVDADLFEVSGKEKRGVFRGNVVARQGDVTIRASRVEAFYSKTLSAIVKAVAEGGVTVTSGGKVGRAEKAEFNNEQRTIVLTGEPRLLEEGTVLEGREIVFHVDDGRVECFECSIDVDPALVKEMKDGKTPLVTPPR